MVVYYLQAGAEDVRSLQWRQICQIVMSMTDELAGVDLNLISKTLADLPGSELAPLALYLISYGNIVILKELWAARGPFQLNLKRDPIENTLTLNGRPFALLSDNTFLFESLSTIKDYRKLFSLIDDMGFSGLIDMTPEGSALFSMGNSSIVKRNCRRRCRFEGDLPTLDAGVLGQGELLQALTMGANKPGMRRAYDHLLCWASLEMVKQYPGLLKPFTAKKEIATNGVSYPLKMTIAAWSERFESDAQAGVVGALPSSICMMNECDDGPDTAKALLKAMGSNGIQYGLEDRPGFVLCHTSAEFLHEFPLATSDMDELNLNKAYDFVDIYFPFDLLHLQAIPGEPLDFNLKVGMYDQSYERFLWMLGSERDVADKVKNLLTPSQFKAMASAETIDGALLKVLKNTFGFDNQGMKVKLGILDVETLKAADFKFAEGTSILSGRVTPLEVSASNGRTVVDIDEIRNETDPPPFMSGKRDMLVKAYEAIISMGLWPCKTLPEPSSVKDALMQCSRKRDLANRYDEVALSLRGYLLSSGAHACAAEAKTPAQWDYLVAALGPEAMKPYLADMPNKARGTIFTSELGI